MKPILQTLTLILSLALFTACNQNDSPDAQTIAIAKITAYAKDGTAVPTLQDYLDAGVTGITEANLADINEIVSNLTPEEVDTQAEIQEILNNIGVAVILTKRVHYLNGACNVYVDKNGTDTDNSGTLEDSEVTSTTAETFTNGTPISEAALRAKINANPMEDITSVNTCQITDMSYLFQRKTFFNQDISSWNTGAVMDMTGLFDSAYSFDKNIGTWNTSAVTDMHLMFIFAYSFNQNIGDWNTSAVTDMDRMFYNTRLFNKNIGSWTTNAVTNVDQMFSYATVFDQNLSEWDLTRIIEPTFFANGSPLENNPANFPKFKPTICEKLTTEPTCLASPRQCQWFPDGGTCIAGF
jgi:surface protein